MLNGTFFVQAMHFFIAYVILDRLLFRPAMVELRADQAEKKALTDAVERQTAAVKQLEQIQTEAWQHAYAQFSSSMPPLYSAGPGIAQEQLIVHELSLDAKKALINTSAAFLIRKIEHVH